MEHKRNSKHNSKRSGGNRRRKYIIDSAFQWKYTLTISLIVFFCTSLMSCILYTVLHEQARQRLLHPTEYTASIGMVILFTAFAFSVLTGGAMGLWCMIATHRICGPLYVLERHLFELARGRLPQVRALRRKDEFKELFRVFSGAVRSMRADKEDLLTVLSDVLHKAKECASADEQSRKQALDSIAEQVEQLRQLTVDALGEEAVQDSPSDCTCGPECRGKHHAKERTPAGVA